MNPLVGIALLSALISVVSCKKENLQLTPAKIYGTWAITAMNAKGTWTSLAIESLYVFDGEGGYTLRKCVGDSPSFASGTVYALETRFSDVDGKVYSVRNSGDVYHFETIKDNLILESSEISRMSFYYEDEFGIGKRLRFERVLRYEERSINGSDIALENDLAGLIADSATGKGIPGVIVSDGYDCVCTDANGVYQFKSNEFTRMVYYSIPSGYKISGSNDAPSLPVFHKIISPDGNLIRTDFTLDPLPSIETSWTFIGIGDPQCRTEAHVARYVDETLADLSETVSGKTSVYAMTLGDIVYDYDYTYPLMRKSMSSVASGSGLTIPFFQTIGNHDHVTTGTSDTTDDIVDDYNATLSFEKYFGPTNYSFDRGDVHIISMDNVQVTTQSSTGLSWNYKIGFTDDQIDWLAKDLSFVENKQDKMAFLCCHIPIRNNSSAKNVQAVLKQLEAFKEVHIMDGHTHCAENVVYNTAHPTAGDIRMYEHIHGSACGAWWPEGVSSTTNGEPSGYTIYEIEGAHIKDWQFKGTRRDKEFQLRVFDGNHIYYPEKYPVSWYRIPQTIGPNAYECNGYIQLQGCFVVQIFNDDDTYWSVDLVRKSTGEKIGSFTRLPEGYNAAMVAYWYNEKNIKSGRVGTVSHYWYYKPASGDPSSETDWEVIATHTLPGGTAEHHYTGSKIIKQADFAKEFYF